HNSTFTADMFIWFRYRDTSPIEDLEFPNVSVPLSFGKPVWVRQRQDLTVATYRVMSTFKAEFNYADYPLDHQVLPIRLRHANKTVNTFIMATDTRGMTIKDRRFDELALH